VSWIGFTEESNAPASGPKIAEAAPYTIELSATLRAIEPKLSIPLVTLDKPDVTKLLTESGVGWPTVGLYEPETKPLDIPDKACTGGLD